jgi:hypothetical protein
MVMAMLTSLDSKAQPKVIFWWVIYRGYDAVKKKRKTAKYIENRNMDLTKHKRDTEIRN